jgi:tetratricopeptide (TPR) repeat protein
MPQGSLALYRRHHSSCPHLAKGNRWTRCHCPIWVQGSIGGETIRRSPNTTNWTAASSMVHRWQASGQIGVLKPEIPTISEAVEKFLKEAAVRCTAARAREAGPSAAPFEILSDDNGLDEASNIVIDLIDAGRLDEAERAAQDLLERYPDVHDGLERLAMVAAARGDGARAPEYYGKAADFVHEHADYGNREMEIYLRKRATKF